MSEQLFSIRLPDGTTCLWPIQEIMAYEDSWQAVLAQGEVFCQKCGAATPDLCICPKQDWED